MNEILYNNLSWDEYLLGDKLGLRYSDDLNSIHSINSLEKRCSVEMNKNNTMNEEHRPIRELFTNRPNNEYFTNRSNNEHFKNRPNNEHFTNRPNNEHFVSKPNIEHFTNRPNVCTCGADSENNTFRSDVVQHSPRCNLRKSVNRQIRMLQNQEEPEYEDEPDVFIKNSNNVMDSVMSIFDNNKILTILVFFLSAICLFQYLNHEEAMEEMNKVLTQIQLLHARNPMMQMQPVPIMI